MKENDWLWLEEWYTKIERKEVKNVLAQERFERILEILREKQSVTVTDLTKWLNTSESTIRRDLTELNRHGLLIKVHGGATAVKSVLSREEEVITKAKKHQSEKRKIGDRKSVV